MATIVSNSVKTRPHRGLGSSAQCYVVEGIHTFTAAPALNDIIQMVNIPRGAVVFMYALYTDDLDTNASPTLLFDIGDGGDVDRFAAAITAPRTGSPSIGMPNPPLAAYQYTADDTIDIKINTAAATWANGTVRLIIFYRMG